MTIYALLSRKVAVAVFAAVAVGAGVLAVATGDDRGENGKAEPSLIANLDSKNARTRDEAVLTILEDRKKTVTELVKILSQSNGKEHSDGTRAVAAFLLGEMRSKEAVPALSKAFKNPPKAPGFMRESPRSGYALNPYDEPIFTALVRIGRPVVPAMITNIEKTDNNVLRQGSLDVLSHVLGGKKHLLELLGKLQARAKDDAVVRRIKAATEHVREHYKETGEGPLY